MANYASSEQTRELLINATGELAAELGFANVSTRAIADRSGQNVGSIHYHFGSKDRLFEQVLVTATQRHREYPLSAILQEHAEELTNPNTQSKVIRKIVHRSVRLIFGLKEPWWRERVIYQVLHSNDPLRELLRTHVIEPDVRHMIKFLQIIKPRISEEQARLHIKVLQGPLVLHAQHFEEGLSMQRTAYTKEYLQDLEDVLVRNFQSYWGLPLDK